MPLKDLSLALLTIVVWGLNFAVIKLGVAGVPPMLLAALRFVCAAFPALLFFRAPRVPLRLYLAYGMLISVGQFALLFTATFGLLWAGFRAHLELPTQRLLRGLGLLLLVLWPLTCPLPFSLNRLWAQPNLTLPLLLHFGAICANINWIVFMNWVPMMPSIA